MKSRKTIIIILTVTLIIASFFAGSYMQKKENARIRNERCGILISFALDKAQNGDLSDEGTVKALVSNVYAAYEMCDDPVISSQLHDLWNVMVSDGDDIAAIREIALIELSDALRAVRTND